MTIENAPLDQKDSLQIFLQEEIDEVRKRLEKLEGKIKEADFNFWKDELLRKEAELKSLTDKDDDQLFFLRKEIASLKEDVASLGFRQRWWTRIPTLGWVAIIVLPFLLYLVVLVSLQLVNSEQIQDLAATQTAAALQTTMPVVTETIALTPIP